MYPLSAYLFKLARWLQRLSRAFTQLARRDALNLTASAPRLSDLLSKSRSGDAADQQVACVCTPCSAAWSAVAILFVSRLADSDANVVRWLRAPALRPRHKIFGRGADEQLAETSSDGCDGCSSQHRPPCHRVAFMQFSRRVRGVSWTHIARLHTRSYR